MSPYNKTMNQTVSARNAFEKVFKYKKVNTHYLKLLGNQLTAGYLNRSATKESMKKNI